MIYLGIPSPQNSLNSRVLTCSNRIGNDVSRQEEQTAREEVVGIGLDLSKASLRGTYSVEQECSDLSLALELGAHCAESRPQG